MKKFCPEISLLALGSPVVETLLADIGQSGRFSRVGVVHLKRRFQVEGDIAHQALLVSQN